MAANGDEGASIRIIDTDLWEEQIKVGLLPFVLEISISKDFGKEKISTEISLIWPPGPQEGLLEQREDYKKYFVWATDRNTAIARMSELNRTQAGLVAIEGEVQEEGVF